MVEIGNFLRSRSRRSFRLAGLFNQSAGPLLAQVTQGIEYPDSAAVRRYNGTLHPSPVGVEIEVVTRLYSGSHIGDGNAVSLLLFGWLSMREKSQSECQDYADRGRGKRRKHLIHLDESSHLYRRNFLFRDEQAQPTNFIRSAMSGSGHTSYRTVSR